MGGLLALTAAGLTGTADYLGGRASRVMQPLAVVTLSQVIGLLAMVALALVANSSRDISSMAFGAAAGVALAGALLALYRGYSVSQVGLVAPVAAVGSASLPVLYGLVTGDRPTLLVSLGLGLGVVAIAQISRGGHGTDRTDWRDPITRTGLMLGGTAGVCFGVLFILLSHVEPGAGHWALAASRVAAAAAAGIAAVGARQSFRMPRGALPIVAGCGALSVLGNGAYLVALEHTMLVIAVLLSSLYPAATVALARILDGELLGARRLVGIAIALGAIALIVTG